MHLLENFHPFANNLQMAVLFECLFGSVEHQVYLALIIGNVLHWCKLLLEILQVVIKRLRLVADRIDISRIRGYWCHGVRTTLRRHTLRIVRRTVEVFDVLLKLVHHVVHILELVERIPLPHNLLTPIKLLLQLDVLLVLLVLNIALRFLFFVLL